MLIHQSGIRQMVGFGAQCNELLIIFVPRSQLLIDVVPVPTMLIMAHATHLHQLIDIYIFVRTANGMN